jgi:sugar/nucleoside kinase (ribokinase family)
MPKSLLVVGSIAMDTLRTPYGEVKDELGGACTFFSVAASYFVPVRLVGAVGEDFPKEFNRVFTSRHIDVALNVLGDFRPEIPRSFRDSRLVFLANGSPVTQASVLDQVEKPDLVVADTMNLWIETQREPLLALLARVDGLVLNEGEAQMLTGEHNLIVAGRKILAMGPKFAVIKKGEHGSLLVIRPAGPADTALTRNVCPLPAYPATEVRDPTGAGDSFAGGMMGYLASVGEYNFQHLIRAMAYGTVAASFAIEDFGLRRFERLSIDEIDRRLHEYHDMLTF